MSQKYSSRCQLTIALFVWPVISQAEISTDGTMGPAVNLSGPDYAISENLGTRTGNNLFHSFDHFNISTGESATFSGAPEISNVIGRVTGGETSSINGALRSTIPNADVYLINPAGIVFGENASIDVNGSFHASTADYLRLGDNGRFDASNPGNTTLSVAQPSAFGFLGAPSGISIDNSRLDAPEGATLTLVGGNIDMQDATLHAPSGQINVVSVASAGEAVMTADGLDTGNFEQLGNIEIRHTGNFYSRPLANLDTSGNPGGTVSIRAGRFVLDNGYIFADNVDGNGGKVDIAADEAVILKNEALVTTDMFANGSGGQITVNTADLVMDSGGIIQANNYGPGSGGSIDIHASDSLSMAGRSLDQLPYIGNIESGLYADSFGQGSGGTITVEATNVTIGDGGKIELNASVGNGNAGKLNMNTRTLRMTDGGTIQTDTFGAGDAGTVSINVGQLEMTGGSNIAATTRGTGDGGQIAVTASDAITISGSNDIGPSGIFTNSFDEGDGGNISIAANRLTVTNGGVVQSAVSADDATAATTAGDIRIKVADMVLSGQGQISTQSENTGQAGNIAVTASDQVSINSGDEIVQSGLFSTTIGSGNSGIIDLTAMDLVMNGGAVNVSSNSTGNAGTISLQLGSLELQNGAQISTSVAGAGNGGDLVIAVDGKATISGQSGSGFSSGLYSTTSDIGNGGNIGLAANTVSINNQGLVTAESTGDGDAGNITILADKSINLEKGFIHTRAVTSDGGNIDLGAASQLYMLNSEITTSVESGFGDGGNITIDPDFVIFNNSRIVANAFGGNGGNILIITDNFIATPNSIVDASSRFGLDGTVIIRSPETDLSSSITDLPASFLDVAALLREPCAARRSVNQSSFIVRGRDAIPPGPMTSLPLADVFNQTPDTGATVHPTSAITTTPVAGVALNGLSGVSNVVSTLFDCAL